MKAWLKPLSGTKMGSYLLYAVAFSLLFLYFGVILLFFWSAHTETSTVDAVASWASLLYSVKVSSYASVLSTLFGACVGVLTFGLAKSVRNVFSLFFSLCLVLPPVVVGVGLFRVWGVNGFLNAWVTAIFSLERNFFYGEIGLISVYCYYNFPLVVLVVWNRLEQIPIKTTQIIYHLGLSNWQTLRWVVWPNIRFSLLGLLGLIFVFCFQDFNLAGLFQSNPHQVPVTVALYQAVLIELNFSKAVFLAIGSFFPGLVYLWVIRKSWLSAFQLSPDQGADRIKNFTPRYSFVGWLFCCFGTGYLLLPFLQMRGLFVNEQITKLLASSVFFMSLQVSLGLALVVSLGALVWALFFLYSSLELRRPMFSELPFFFLVCPSVIFSLGLFFLFFQSSWRHTFGLYLTAVLVVQIFQAIPLGVFLLKNALFLNRLRYDRLAKQLGLSFHQKVWWIDMPWMQPFLLWTWAVLFCFSLGDLSAISVFGKKFETLSGLSKVFMSRYQFALAEANNALLICLCLLVFTVALFVAHKAKRC